MDEFGTALSSSDQVALRDALMGAEAAMDRPDIETVKRAHERLALAAQTLATNIYAAARQDVASGVGGRGGSAGAVSIEDDLVDDEQS